MKKQESVLEMHELEKRESVEEKKYKKRTKLASV
jgi:hypothetical protein